MTRAGVKIAALVLNDSGDGAVPIADIATTLARFLPLFYRDNSPRRGRGARGFCRTGCAFGELAGRRGGLTARSRWL